MFHLLVVATVMSATPPPGSDRGGPTAIVRPADGKDGKNERPPVERGPEPAKDTEPRPVLTTNREWNVLTAGASARQKFRQAGERLGRRRFNLAGVWVDGPKLIALAENSDREPLTRAAREALERPVDVDDLLLFIDDLLSADLDLEAQPAYLTAGRGRRSGVLLHPQDVFRDRPRVYGKAAAYIPLDFPKPQTGLVPAKDGSVVSPDWAARYRQPTTQAGRMKALEEANPSFARRVATLIAQLRKQGAMVFVEATVRPRERGYLLYGSYVLSRSKTQEELDRHIEALESFNESWGLGVPIQWKHPGGWRATVDAARQLADTFGVVYATKRGAKSSDHYDGSAIDLFAVNLPRELRLEAPDGAKATFDLYDPSESRDLNLSPKLIEWIEEHYSVEKLRRDYPHWTDAKP